MSTLTPNFGLKKPAYSDTADIADINDNMDIVDEELSRLENGLDKSNCLGRNTGYVYQYSSWQDANDYLTEFHGFVFNVTNLPDNYGFLDVSYFDGVSFSPSATGVWRQMFTHFSSGNVYIRMKLGTGGSWSDWRRLMDNSALVRERYTITATTPAAGGTTPILSQTFSKTGYKPIMFSVVPGAWIDHCGLNCESATISNNTFITGDISVTAFDSVGAGQTCALYFDVLYAPI